MDSEAATENEWSESEHEWSETEDDVREARVHGAEGPQKSVVDGADGLPVGLVRVVETPVAGRAHGGGRASGGAMITIELAGRRPPGAGG